jgi:hypothetical protein
MGSLRLDDIAVLVFTSALKLRERALSVQETWLKAFSKGYLVGGWKGDPKLRMISLGAEVGEDYKSAHKKQFLGLLEMLRRFPEAKWFFITGCDAFVYAENLRALLDSYDSSKELLVGGHCGSVRIDGEDFLFPAGGPGFALSRPLAEALAGKIPEFVEAWPRERPELDGACDVAMAYLARRERGVGLSYAEGFYSCPPYRYPENTYKDGEGRDVNRAAIARPIAFHMLSIREMYSLNRGARLKAPRLFTRGFDRFSTLMTRRLHTKSIVNRIAGLLFG